MSGTHRERLRNRAVRLLVAACVGTAALMATPAQAQTSGVALHLLSEPIWTHAGDRLGLRLKVDNAGTTPLQGFRVVVGLYDRVQSRSELHSSFSQLPDFAPSTFPVDFSQRVAPGASATVEINGPSSKLGLLTQSGQDGVYPLKLSLTDLSGATILDSVTSDLLYFPTAPGIPLNMVLALPLDALPARGPDGVFRPDPSGHIPLASALGDGGWLSGIAGALRRDAGRSLHLGVAPTPRLIEELADLSNGYRGDNGGAVREVGADATTRAATTFLNELRRIVGRSGVQVLLSPYSFADLPSLAHNLDPFAVQNQIQVGRAALTAALRTDVRREWIFPPAGRLDATTLAQLQSGDAGRKTFFSSSSLEQPSDPALEGCPQANASFTCTVSVPSAQGATHGYQSDADIQAALTELTQSGNDRLNLQRFFAETAMVWAELPETTGRVVQATLPALWSPRPWLTRLLFSGLSQAPWLKTLTPEEGMHAGLRSVTKRAVPDAPPLPNDPGPSYYSMLGDAQSYVSGFTTIGPPSTLVDRLTNDVLVAQSRAWWSDPQTLSQGEAFASDARGEAAAALGKITIGGISQITMTSRSGKVPVVLFNNTGFPVRVTLHLFSPSLGLNQSLPERLASATQPITVPVTAKASGIFPLQISLETPDGSIAIGRRTIQLRSTNFNQVAVGITIGALIFLVLFYLQRGMRRRRQRHQQPEATTA